MEDAVKRYKIRRSRRMKKRMDAEEDGEWKTTSEGHRILIKDGAVAGGNPFTLAVMGAPDKAMPKKSVELKKGCPYDKVKKENRADLANAVRERKDKSCIFGGFYKVEENSGATLTDATFFNPYTGEHFNAIVRDTDGHMEDEFSEELYDMSVNREAKWLWRRSNKIVQEGDSIRVVKGKTIAHGTEAKVRKVYPMKDRYGRWVADYAYLDNGEKINVNNIKILEDGKEL